MRISNWVSADRTQRRATMQLPVKIELQPYMRENTFAQVDVHLTRETVALGDERCKLTMTASEAREWSKRLAKAADDAERLRELAGEDAASMALRMAGEHKIAGKR